MPRSNPLQRRFHPKGLTLSTVAILGCWLCNAAVANGYFFFHAFANSQDDNIHYVGVVRDEQGKPVRAARVTLEIPTLDLTFVMWTDAAGRYRSSSIRRTIDPKVVSVAAAQDGYQQLKAGPRISFKAGAALLVETDFVVRKLSSPAATRRNH